MEDRLLELLESVLGKSKRTSGDNYAFYSPFVDHYKPKLEVNIKITSDGRNPWHCWISDEKGRTIKTLFKKLRVSKQTWDEYNSIFSRINRYNTEYQNDSVTEVVELPKEFKPLYKPSKSFKYKHALNYLLKRGVRPEDIVKYNIGYCEEGEYEIRRNAIPLFGKSIQSELEKKIVANKVKKLYICLDSDAISNAIGLSKKFMSYGIDTHLVDLGEKDPSEMGYDDINQKIYDTPPLDLRKLMEYQLFSV